MSVTRTTSCNNLTAAASQAYAIAKRASTTSTWSADSSGSITVDSNGVAELSWSADPSLFYRVTFTGVGTEYFNPLVLANISGYAYADLQSVQGSTDAAQAIGILASAIGTDSTAGDKSNGLMSMGSAYTVNGAIAASVGNVTVGGFATGVQTALALAIQAGIIDETDGQQVLTAIVNKINATDSNLSGLTITAIAAGVRTNLATELGRIDGSVSGVAASVWTNATRTLSSFGTLAADTSTAVWGATTKTITGGTVGSVTGNVGGISGVTFPTNFSTLLITTGGHIATVDNVVNAIVLPAVAPSGYGGGDLSGIQPYLSQILDQLQTDPPTSTGGQQYRSRAIIIGDAYGPTARAFTISRHRSAEWPLDLSQWTWALKASKDADNTNSGTTLVGTVAVGVATGDGRSLSVTMTAASTATLAIGRHNYAAVGTNGSSVWSVELGTADARARPS